MAGLHYKSATIWENKFRTPTGEELLSGVPRSIAPLLEAARRRLLEVPTMKESVAWQGTPWRWTFAFRTETDSTRPWAYLVPDPSKPRIVLSLTMDELSRFPIRKLTKPARDPLSHGVEVDGVHWVEWEITGRALLDEVLALALACRAQPAQTHG